VSPIASIARAEALEHVGVVGVERERGAIAAWRAGEIAARVQRLAVVDQRRELAASCSAAGGLAPGADV
jgi:hypothetical protein